MEKVENYLVTLGITYESIGEKTWLVNDDEKGLEQLVIMAADPLVVVRVKVMSIPSDHREELYKTLLELNGTDLVHGSYGIDGEDIVLVDTLEHATMDLEDFQASLDTIGLALAQHFKVLSKYRD
ncbi:MAG: hypothetical protein JXB03_12605 [Spirochaetales bacterium]|nr:hypothetical protein [Spirochaetales bacterium]